jgi:hypothetical protein
MAPRKSDVPASAKSATTMKPPGAGVVKRQYKNIRFPENGLLDVKRKTGKFLKQWVMLHYLSARLTMGSYHG